MLQSAVCERNGSTETNARRNGDLICVYLRSAAYECFLLAVLCFAESLSSLPPNTQLSHHCPLASLAGVSIEDNLEPYSAVLPSVAFRFAIELPGVTVRASGGRVESFHFLNGKTRQAMSRRIR